MKRDWLLYLVIFSLALNLGTIGTLAYLRWQSPPAPPPPPKAAPLPFHKLLEELNLDPQQRQTLRKLVPGHFRQVLDLERNVAKQRRELFDLFKQENPPDWQTVQAKLREIGNLQLRLEEEKVSHLLELQKNLTAEQRRLLVTNLERRLAPLWERPGGAWGLRRHLQDSGQAPGHHGPPGPPAER